MYRQSWADNYKDIINKVCKYIQRVSLNYHNKHTNYTLTDNSQIMQKKNCRNSKLGGKSAQDKKEWKRTHGLDKKITANGFNQSRVSCEVNKGLLYQQ